MDREVVINELTGIIGDYLKNQGLVLVELVYRHEGRDLSLRILVDRPEGGINLGECANLNKEIGMTLDERGIVQEGYILEVSSPGLDRPLKNKNDFSCCINRRVRIFLKELINGKPELEGVIAGVGEDVAYIALEDKTLEVPFLKIFKAKQVF